MAIANRRTERIEARLLREQKIRIERAGQSQGTLVFGLHGSTCGMAWFPSRRHPGQSSSMPKRESATSI
jgi:hypothetical protein